MCTLAYADERDVSCFHLSSQHCNVRFSLHAANDLFELFFWRWTGYFQLIEVECRTDASVKLRHQWLIMASTASSHYFVNAESLLIEPLEINSNKIWIEMQQFT